ncbi:RhoGEF domain containing protein [Brugia malayi]|uniref:RhoGEF domain containing protein n=1 Tax=Brugia malayi TaxID=6279 RepID=A0A4E9FKX1_BRUMA|nr:RhoGEF domain containing protein [Brugia malayi]VIO97084.1 RhoGEF domain containing protein [Brugia malayi]
MKPLNKYFSDAISVFPSLEVHKFFQIHGLCKSNPNGKPVIELRISSEVPFDLLPSLIFSTYSLYTRCSDKKHTLYIIIDVRNCSEECLHTFLQTLRQSASWLEGTIDCILWVIGSSLPNIETIINEDLILSRAKNIMADIEGITKYIEAGSFSTYLNGLIDPEITRHFLQMRFCVEDLLKKTHKTAKLYMSLHEYLKQFEVPQDLTTANADLLREQSEELKNRWNAVKDEPDVIFLLHRGEILCEELKTQYNNLHHLDSYLFADAVNRAVSGFEEVKVVMQRSSSSISKRLYALKCSAEAVEFLKYVPQLMEFINNEIDDLEQLKVIRIFSVVRLTSQIKQVDSKTTELTRYLDEADSRLKEVVHLPEEGSFGNVDRKRITDMFDSFSSFLVSCKQRVMEVRPIVQAALDSRIHIDQVYNWALLHAKRSDNEKEKEMLVSKYPSTAIARLHEYVAVSSTDCTVRQEIEKLLSDCEKAIMGLDPTLKICDLRCQMSASSSQESGDGTASQEVGAVDSCFSGEADCSIIDLSLPKSRCSDLSDSVSDTPMEVYSDVEESFTVDLRNDLNATEHSRQQTSPAPTQYEIPISKATTSTEHQQPGLTELEEVRWRRNSWAPSVHTGPLEIIEESAIGAAPVTLNMTNKVITSMSTNTLHKRLDQRRSASTVPLRLPNPFLINGAARPGSARFVVSQKSRRPLMRTSSSDFLEEDCRSALSAFQFLDDDCCSISESSPQPTIASAFSALDFSMRSEQIDMIRDWLSPAKTSDANFRIECTVVRDLLDSEIDYVSALRLVVQDFMPEMARVDIPSALRGKKSCIFGNIEKLFQFHAHSFLPQLISRLRFRCADESVSMTTGRLFLDNLSYFELYALYAKNKPKSDQLMREAGHKFFSSVQSLADLSHLLIKPIERIGKYALALQQLLNAAPPNKVEVVEVLEKVAMIVGQQIRRGTDLLAMERISSCDLNLKEQGNLLRHDTMYVTEKRGLQSKKRVRSVFLFENCVVLTKPKLSRSWRGNTFDELKYKSSIQMTDCGLTEMVKDSKVKFELWFRKQKNSFTYVMESQTASIRDAWVEDIRNILWNQAIRSREKNIREKANMGIELHSSYIHLGPRATLSGLRDFGFVEGTRRPCSLISLTASSCSSSNNLGRVQGRGTCEISGDLCRVEEGDEWESMHESSPTVKYAESTLPRFRAPPPPDLNQ